ncbi:MAG: anti-sigma F factor [Clostridia bacterium]|nr:anti-sigma F factor [Clostridia bacterium]
MNTSKSKKINELKMSVYSLSVNEAASRAMTGAFCAQINPTATEIADIKCALSEAVTNCIVHGYKGGIGNIYITVTIYENKLVKITVKDKGVGIPDVKCAMQPLYTTDKSGERSGMGFCVMESFMDKIKVSSAEGRGTTVTMFKQITGEKIF